MEDLIRKLFPESYTETGRINSEETLKGASTEALVSIRARSSNEEKSIKKPQKKFSCELCNRSLASKGGKTNHQNKCKKKENLSDSSANEIKTKQVKTVPVWGPHPIEDLEQIAEALYNEVTKWRKNIFELPSGSAGKKFIQETTRLISNWNNKAQIGNVSMILLFVMPSLLLQKPRKASKSKEHSECLSRRLTKWIDGDFNDIILECRAIQNRFVQSYNVTEESIAKRFNNMMLQGKINSALNLLSNERSSGVLLMNKKVMESLMEKHPEPLEKFDELLLQGPRAFVHPSTFDNIDGTCIQKASVGTKGAAGPSKMDANAWRRMLLSKAYGSYSTDLANAIATMAKIMCTESCAEKSERNMENFVASILIPLDKNPGVRPIGIGEVLRRIVGKTIMSHLKNDVMEAAGGLQLCAGQQSGCESAVHAMREIYENDDTEAILLVDASNAFNSMNRQVMIHNTFIICPTLAMFASNCYQQTIRLFIIGGGELLSKEGTTQGDPISMAIYGLNLTPLMSSLKSSPETDKIKHEAFADDLAGAGKISQINIWWKQLKSLGPKIGYFPNETKSWLIVKEKHLKKAERIFEDCELNITSEGRKHLGASIGSTMYKEKYTNTLVAKWVKELALLANIARTYPQAAYIAFTAGYRHKFNYYIRTLKDISNLLQPVEDVIRNLFIPALCNGRQCSDVERQLFSLPTKLGGLGIINVTEIAEREFSNSSKICQLQKTS